MSRSQRTQGRLVSVDTNDSGIQKLNSQETKPNEAESSSKKPIHTQRGGGGGGGDGHHAAGRGAWQDDDGEEEEAKEQGSSSWQEPMNQEGGGWLVKLMGESEWDFRHCLVSGL